MWDVDGNRYLDMLVGYSALNQGHRHPRLVDTRAPGAARHADLARVPQRPDGSVPQGAVRGDGIHARLPMNTGAEAVETAIKMVRKWGYKVKGCPRTRRRSSSAQNNFHGRTTTIVGLLDRAAVPRRLRAVHAGLSHRAVRRHRGAGEGDQPQHRGRSRRTDSGRGRRVVPPAATSKGRELCQKHNVLMIADEIQTGLGRTRPSVLHCDHEGVIPTCLILGKALSGGGFYPVSAVVAERGRSRRLRPGDHGSTFGGNPLACAIGREALAVFVDEQLCRARRKARAEFTEELRDHRTRRTLRRSAVRAS